MTALSTQRTHARSFSFDFFNIFVFTLIFAKF
jgi:hypothetical protein